MRTFKICFLSKFQIYKIILTIVTMLYVTSPGLSYNWKFVTFDHRHAYHPISTPGPWKPPICSPYPWSWWILFLGGCFFNLVLDYTYKWGVQHLSFSVWLSSLNLMPSSSIHVAANVRISFFLWLNNVTGDRAGGSPKIAKHIPQCPRLGNGGKGRILQLRYFS